MFKNFGKFDTHLYARCLNNEFRKRETLKLYREVLKFAHMFTWQDETGVQWSDILRNSARQEIESSKQEKDPEILARALVNARMALDDAQEKFKLQQMQIQTKEAQRQPWSPSQNRPMPNPFHVQPPMQNGIYTADNPFAYRTFDNDWDKKS